MWILLTGRPVLIEKLAATLTGCDGVPRTWCDPNAGVAAASLAPCFVPEDAFDVQPLVNEERVFVCHARLDNREELLQQLGIENGSAFADSSLLAAAYDRWAADCVQHVVGDFSFAAWHRSDGRIVGAVDPIGVRRLCWTRVADGFALSAQMPPLLEHPDVSREPDLHSMATLFDAGVDRTSTPFRAIRAIPGGHVVTFRGADVNVSRWWKPEWQPSIRYRDHREYVEDLREHFTRATTSLLRSTTPISSTLSGGLDSGSVTSLAAQLLAGSGARIAAYTSVPEPGLAPSQRPNWEADDSDYAAEVAAQHRNVDHFLVTPGGRCVLDVLPSIHTRSQTPSRATPNLLWLDRISTLAASSGSRVLLTGFQGNTAFSWRGDGTVWELLMHGRLRAAAAQIAIEASARGVSRASVAARELYDATLRKPPSIDARLHGLRFLRNPAAARARGNEYAVDPRTRKFWMRSATTPRHAWAPEPVRQWGIEWRDPTGDRRLLERLLRYPQAAFRAGGRSRGLARELRLLPDRVRNRRTQGAQVPEGASLIAAHAGKYAAALATMERSAACRELFDFTAIRASLDAIRNGSRDHYVAVVIDRTFDVGIFLARQSPK